MKKALVVLATLIIGLQVYGETSPEVLDQWIAFYYRNPSPDTVAANISDLAGAGLLSPASPTVGFLSELFREDGARIAPWMEHWKDLELAHKRVLWDALAQANTPEARMALKKAQTDARPGVMKEIDRLLDNPPPEIEYAPVKTPDQISTLWGAFFASGRESYVQAVIKALKAEDADNKAMANAVAGTAQWSLVANAIRDDTVLNIIEARAKKEDGLLSRALSEIAANARRERTIRELRDATRIEIRYAGEDRDEDNIARDGDFEVQIWAVDDTGLLGTLTEAKASVALSPVEKVYRGRPFFAALFFANPAAKDGTANVTADLLILRPDGTTYGELNDVVCWKEASPGPDLLQLCRANLTVVIEPQDPAGRYTIQATVKDLAGERQVIVKTHFDVD